MSAVPRVKARPRGKCLRLSHVDWKTYTKLMYLFAERHDIRLIYDRGELEMMTPLLQHDNPAWFLGTMVQVLTEELGLPLRGGGSTTMRRRLKKRGIEADECFWIENAPQMAGRLRLDLRRDPPPDLAIEVDVTHGSLDRLAIYAELKLPEVWRFKGEELTFYVLDDHGKYQKAAVSRSFPILTPADVIRFVQRSHEAANQNIVIQEFREWIRQRRSTK